MHRRRLRCLPHVAREGHAAHCSWGDSSGNCRHIKPLLTGVTPEPPTPTALPYRPGTHPLGPLPWARARARRWGVEANGVLSPAPRRAQGRHGDRRRRRSPCAPWRRLARPGKPTGRAEEPDRRHLCFLRGGSGRKISAEQSSFYSEERESGRHRVTRGRT